MGGICRARTFRMTFSHTSGLTPTSCASAVSSVRPPRLARSLWQDRQYRVTNVLCEAAGAARIVEGGGDCWPASSDSRKPLTTTNVATTPENQTLETFDIFVTAFDRSPIHRR